MNNTTVSFLDTHETYWVNIISLINESIPRYVMLFILLIGNIGSIINCIIFSQPSLRKSPCGMYFIASNISQFLIFNFALLTRIFLYGFNVKTVYFEIWYCKFRNYFFYVLLANARYYTILASIDRYLVSCRDVTRRQWSSSKIAMRLIIGNIFFWCLMYIHVIVFYEIYPNNCLPRKGLYRMIFSIYMVVDNGILPVVLMIIFGLLTHKNVGKIKRNVRPMATNITGNQLKKDTQFIKMLLNQISVYCILNLLNPCFLLYQTLTLNMEKSSVRLEVEALLNNLSYFLIYIGFSLTFFLNLFSSSLFRNEFKRFIHMKMRHRRTTQITSTTIQNRITR